MAVSTLRNIDEENEHLVYGYVRNLAENAPKEVTNICLAFYIPHDQWDKKAIHEAISLKPDKTTIEQIKHFQSVNAFLCKEFNSGYHYWEFKCIALNEDHPSSWSRIMIGIVDMNEYEKPPLDGHFDQEKYAKGEGSQSVAVNKPSDNGTKLKPGDYKINS